MDDVPTEYRRDVSSPRPRVQEPETLRERVRAWLDAHRDRQGLRRPDGKKPSPNEMQAHTWYWVVAFVLLMLFQAWWISHQTVEPVSYSRFLELLDKHELKSVEVEGAYVTAQLQKPMDNGHTVVTTTMVSDDLVKRFQAAGVEFTGVVPSTLLSSILSWVLPLGLMFLALALRVPPATRRISAARAG